MDSNSAEYPDKIDLENCAKEPIHIIGRTQSHGVLIACHPATFEISQCGTNSGALFAVDHNSLLGQNISMLFGHQQLEKLKSSLASEELSIPQEVEINGEKFLMLGHFSDQSLVLDFEPVKEVHDPYFFQKQLTRILNKFQSTETIEALANSAANLVKKMFGYDRVMIYRFDDSWNGEVIAEKKEEEMESWLGLHYPATDIPAQSRALFLKHKVRLISDVHYEPVPIKPEISPLSSQPLDISRSGLRAVSPIHIEYLKNMDVGASLSAAVVVKGKLWGLIACHHRTAKFLDHYQRESCRFLSQMLSTEITLQESRNYIQKTETSEVFRQRLVDQMQDQEDVMKALGEEEVKFTDLISCGGGALYFYNKWSTVGNTPSEEELRSLFYAFLSQQKEELFYTSNLSAVFPEAEAYKKTAAGVLCLRISANKYMIWFRPEVIQTVTWGGNPHEKAFFNEKENRISPRKSFQKWSEKLTGISEAWEESDLGVVKTLRDNVIHVVLAKQRKEIEALNEKLVEANEELELFSYGLSHDLRAPLRGVDGFLKLIQEDFAENLGKDGIKMLQMTRDLAAKMNALIDDILAYSGLHHSEAKVLQEVDTKALIIEVLEFFNVKASYPKAVVKIQKELPLMKGDRRMLFQLWSNLLNNALKYSEATAAPIVEVGTEERNGHRMYFVRDNGIGIKKEFQDKIFETFTRVAGGKYEGSGIGLAIVKKIVEKHSGRIFVESTPGRGSVFYFCLECPETE